MRNANAGVGCYGHLVLLTVVLLAACSAPQTVPETPEAIHEAQVTLSLTEERGAIQPAATYTPYPTFTLYPTYTSLPAPSAIPTSTPLPASTGTPALTKTASPTSTATVAPTTRTAAKPESATVKTPKDTLTPLPQKSLPAGAPTGRAIPLSIPRLEDTDPGPPFSILVSSIRAGEDGVKVTGTVRNDGSEIYEAIGVTGTFFNDTGFWLGSVEAHCPCPFLEPGAECPFSLETYPGDYTGYRLHPEGRRAEQREPASLVWGSLHLSNDGIGNVRIKGTAINKNPFSVKHATVAGALVDASGGIVSVGSTLLIGELEPGASVPVDFRIKYEPYARYQLYAQGTRE